LLTFFAQTKRPFFFVFPPIVAVCLNFAQLLPSFHPHGNLPLTMKRQLGIFVVGLVRQCIKMFKEKGRPEGQPNIL